jgi:hypothetical protein
MRRVMLVMILAGGVWPLLSHAVVRDNFLIRNT